MIANNEYRSFDAFKTHELKGLSNLRLPRSSSGVFKSVSITDKEVEPMVFLDIRTPRCKTGTNTPRDQQTKSPTDRMFHKPSPRDLLYKKHSAASLSSSEDIFY
jgi:hypothetical protein